jgi:hypothetical protein
MVLPAGAPKTRRRKKAPPRSRGMAVRGAGRRDTRQLNDALDSLGCQHDESVQSEHLILSAAQLGRNFAEVLAIYGDIVLRPRLEDAAFEPCRDLAMQDLASLEDEPARKCMTQLREKFYPYPLGRSAYGTAQSLQSLTAQKLRDHLAGRSTPAERSWRSRARSTGRRCANWSRNIWAICRRQRRRRWKPVPAALLSSREKGHRPGAHRPGITRLCPPATSATTPPASPRRCCSAS